ncbi:hypothetical protein AB0K27_05260 [Micromonospora echinospora]|uniref:hypothetical protein n=1 Tax=Micromonospora echinospora TaxID=1877 RepID=UPI003424D272
MSPDTVVPPRLDVRLRRFQGSILAAEHNVDPATALDDAVDIRVALTDLLPERYECAAGRVARPRLAARPQRRRSLRRHDEPWRCRYDGINLVMLAPDTVPTAGIRPKVVGTRSWSPASTYSTNENQPPA